MSSPPTNLLSLLQDFTQKLFEIQEFFPINIEKNTERFKLISLLDSGLLNTKFKENVKFPSKSVPLNIKSSFNSLISLSKLK